MTTFAAFATVMFLGGFDFAVEDKLPGLLLSANISYAFT